MAGASTYVTIDDNIFCHMLSLGGAACGPCDLASLLHREARGTRRKPSPKNLVESLIIIPYQNRLSYPHNGSAEIAGRSEHQPGQDLVCRRRSLQIKRGHFLAFGSNEAVRRTRHGQRLCPSELPTGRHRFAYCNTPCLQKPGGFCTGCSALAMIIPVHVGCHPSPFTPL